MITGAPRSPSFPLAIGLVTSLLTILAVGLYTTREIRELREEQTAIAERNRLDSLQLLRIQNNLAVLSTTMRDMAERTEPYPLVAWRQTFERLRNDLRRAIADEQNLAPAERPVAQQQRLVAATERYFELLDGVFATASTDEEAAIAQLRGEPTMHLQELVALVSQFLVLNNRVQEEASRRNEAIYGRVEREIAVLVGALLLVVAVTGLYVIRANRRAFDEVARLSAELRGLSRQMLRTQEELQTEFSRELHDEFGQIFTAVGTLLGRVKRNLPAESPLAADLEEVRQIAQQTLEKIRVQSRLLHPVILDDFGLEKALEWYVEQFGRQHGITTHFEPRGPIGVLPPESTIHVYRIVQEALTNVSRHAGSPEAWVRLSQADGWLELTIEDRGRGVAADGVTRGIGLVSMRERAQLMGGRFSIGPAPGGGTRVTVQVPLAAARVAAAAEGDEEEARRPTEV